MEYSAPSMHIHHHGDICGWVLRSNGDVGVSWVGAAQQWRHGLLGGVEQQWRHGRVLGRCWSEMETRVRAAWVLIINGDMGACWAGLDHQWRHGCVCVCWLLTNNGHMNSC